MEKQKEEKEKKTERKVWSFWRQDVLSVRMSLASGCPWRQDVPGVRIPGVSYLVSGRSRQDVLLCVSLALASSIPVLGLESVCPRKGCPWPWPRIFLSPWPWPRALCPRLHLCWLSSLYIYHWYYFNWGVCITACVIALSL